MFITYGGQIADGKIGLGVLINKVFVACDIIQLFNTDKKWSFCLGLGVCTA